MLTLDLLPAARRRPAVRSAHRRACASRSATRVRRIGDPDRADRPLLRLGQPAARGARRRLHLARAGAARRRARGAARGPGRVPRPRAADRVHGRRPAGRGGRRRCTTSPSTLLIWLVLFLIYQQVQDRVIQPIFYKQRGPDPPGGRDRRGARRRPARRHPRRPAGDPGRRLARRDLRRALAAAGRSGGRGRARVRRTRARLGRLLAPRRPRSAPRRRACARRGRSAAPRASAASPAGPPRTTPAGQKISADQRPSRTSPSPR